MVLQTPTIDIVCPKCGNGPFQLVERKLITIDEAGYTWFHECPADDVDFVDHFRSSNPKKKLGSPWAAIPAQSAHDSKLSKIVK